MKQQVTSKTPPSEVIDKDGDTWVLCPNGKYELESLGRRGIGSATLTYIERNIGVRTRIWR